MRFLTLIALGGTFTLQSFKNATSPPPVTDCGAFGEWQMESCDRFSYNATREECINHYTCYQDAQVNYCLCQHPEGSELHEYCLEHAAGDHYVTNISSCDNLPSIDDNDCGNGQPGGNP